jgi:hypothetical protein
MLVSSMIVLEIDAEGVAVGKLEGDAPRPVRQGPKSASA